MVHPHQLVLNRHGDANPVPGGPGEGPVMLPDPAAFVRTDPPNEARPTFNERFAPGSTVESVTALYKIANDIRLLCSGPESGLGELMIPANEPGSSIMPGKVNPTQCEAMSMAAVQVMGYDLAVGFGAAGGYLEMNAYKPLVIFNVLQSARLIADAVSNFADFLVKGMRPDEERIRDHLNRSLMLITALSPKIGYDRASEIVHLARREKLTLKEAALRLGYVTEEEFNRLVNPTGMAHGET